MVILGHKAGILKRHRIFMTKMGWQGTDMCQTEKKRGWLGVDHRNCGIFNLKKCREWTTKMDDTLDLNEARKQKVAISSLSPKSGYDFDPWPHTNPKSWGIFTDEAPAAALLKRPNDWSHRSALDSHTSQVGVGCWGLPPIYFAAAIRVNTSRLCFWT